MKIHLRQIVTVLLALAVLLSAAGAQPNSIFTRLLDESAETQIVGGISCAGVWGFGLAVGVATLSPCSFLCATMAWYTLLALADC